MTDGLGMPWECVATDARKGNRIFQRTIVFPHTGNNEGTMTDEIEIRGPDDTVLASNEMSIDWAYFGQIDASFENGGRQVRVSGSGEPSEVLTLPTQAEINETGQTPASTTEE